MSRLIINGGKSLCGTVIPSGSKNAALPIIFSTMLMRGTSVLYGVPDISDVHVALEIIKDFGAYCTRVGDALYIDTTTLEYKKPRVELVGKIRASSYLLGACLSRFGKAHISAFGGCNFENRPIDMHIKAAIEVGASVYDDTVVADKLVGADIRFDKVSVGATVNALLLATCAKGKSRIFGYASEPHIHSLIVFLRTAGAQIKVSDKCIEIEGRELCRAMVNIIPDMIEAGTFLSIALACGGDVSVKCSLSGELESFFEAFAKAGVICTCVDGISSFSGKIDTPCEIITAPHPGFATDLQPQSAVAMATNCGGRIVEGVWKSRFGYLGELAKFGVKYELSGSSVAIKPSRLHSAEVSVPDLRGGAALVIAALAAEGETVINDAEIIGRGYESFVDKLRMLGANVYIAN